MYCLTNSRLLFFPRSPLPCPAIHPSPPSAEERPGGDRLLPLAPEERRLSVDPVHRHRLHQPQSPPRTKRHLGQLRPEVSATAAEPRFSVQDCWYEASLYMQAPHCVQRSFEGIDDEMRRDYWKSFTPSNMWENWWGYFQNSDIKAKHITS